MMHVDLKILPLRVKPQAYHHWEVSPQYRDVEENVHGASGRLCTVLHKVYGLVKLH